MAAYGQSVRTTYRALPNDTWHVAIVDTVLQTATVDFWRDSLSFQTNVHFQQTTIVHFQHTKKFKPMFSRQSTTE
eukprot:scaffold2200_cov112-Cylindrotheca_fusiformis.AAC.5